MNSNFPKESPIKILILEPNRLLRDTFVQLLRKRTHLSVEGDSLDNTGEVKELATLGCDVLLLSSVKTLRTIGQRPKAAEYLRNTKVVMFGMDEDQESFLQAVRLGACGYLLKEASSTEIISAVHSVVRGEAICTPKLCRLLFEYLSKEMPNSSGAVEQVDPVSELTCRQRQLMALVARGMTNKEIAASLRLSEFTIKNHIHRIMAHLHVDSRHGAVDVIRTAALFLGTEDNQARAHSLTGAERHRSVSFL